MIGKSRLRLQIMWGMIELENIIAYGNVSQFTIILQRTQIGYLQKPNCLVFKKTIAAVIIFCMTAKS